MFSMGASAPLGSRMLLRTLTVILSGICLLTTVKVSSAACSVPWSLESGNKEKNIAKIMESGRCLREEQHARVGKWFCYVDKMAGIQTDDQKRVTSGNLKPANEKFFVTISELSEDLKGLMCDRGEYGVDPYQPQSNHCLANFKIEFSPSMGFFNASVDTYRFYSADDSFSLYGPDGNFVLVQNGEGNSYVSHGRCEKLN
jgi:hypothetical protein